MTDMDLFALGVLLLMGAAELAVIRWGQRG